jgi:hypothetical protein
MKLVSVLKKIIYCGLMMFIEVLNVLENLTQ